jgi:hypothetical protein
MKKSLYFSLEKSVAILCIFSKFGPLAMIVTGTASGGQGCIAEGFQPPRPSFLVRRFFAMKGNF